MDYEHIGRNELTDLGEGIMRGRILQLCSIYDYCEVKKQGKIVKVFDDRRMRIRKRLPITRDEYNNNTTDHVEKITGPIYVAELNDVQIVGDSDYILKDSWYLNDILVNNDVVCGMPLKLEKYDNKVGISTIDISKSIHIDCGIDLIKMWSANYYHYMVEALSRLQYIDQLYEYNDYPLLIDKAVWGSRHYMDLLNIFNDNHRNIISVAPNQVYTVDKLIYPSFHSWHYAVPFDGKRVSGDTVIDFEAIRRFKDKIQNKKNFYPRIKPGKKLFLARENDARLINNSQVGSFLFKNGYSIIEPSRMTLDEKIECFKDCDIVIGAMGTQFMNLIYAPQGCRAYIICPYELQDRAFDDYLEAIGIKYRYLDCQIITLGATVNTSTFMISLDDLNNRIIEMGI